ncbi:proteinrelated to tpa inducible protein [Purpureocillium lavendulum]|uniref:Transcription initiation factor TFIID subunit 4 n=1 Tax=Purpureocillium lavendulum TaxID=1247861 RepID=A0AB34FL46_9HYPO|nr:proteinrelated to tpa inducible protein [Purpureocillium lavendulum]
MAQPQHQAPPSRAFSPPQHSPSPAAGTPSAYALPPNKRVRTDGPPSQPGSPYAASPFAASPGAAGTPPMTAASPTFSATPPMSATYAAAPYTNGTATPTLNLPDGRANSATPVQTPHGAPPQMAQPQYTNAMMAPIQQAVASPAPTPNVMGPPQRPADRPTKDYEYDVTDSLAGTGIDLRAEEQYMSDLYSNALDSNTADARTGFAYNQAGSKSSFYGAGSANQPAEPTTTSNQDELAAKAAERAWTESSMRLAVQRTQEINDPFLLVALLHQRAEKIAREHGIGLNLEMKNPQPMGKMRLPEQFPQPQVTVRMAPGPDSTMVQTTGSYIPQESFLVDQLALMSIAAKHRLRGLVEEAGIIAIHRQKTSHGDVPEEWEPAAAPMNVEVLESMHNPDERMETDSAQDSGTNPLKRKSRRRTCRCTYSGRANIMSSGSADAAVLGDGATPPPPKKLPKIGGSNVTVPMRERARQDREWEEARLRKRQRRKDGGQDGTATPTRAGSAAPATPGSVAPEPEKAMTKKEMKKNQALKAAEANSHANQNLTSSMFAGLGGKGGLFGKKKTGKTYDWMNVGRASSGASTPTRATPGPKGASGVPGTPAGANHPLTTEGRNRLGTWREDKEKGKNIQLRDWVVVLERDGREGKALSTAHSQLDLSLPR